jgi:hypothetical protein
MRVFLSPVCNIHAGTAVWKEQKQTAVAFVARQLLISTILLSNNQVLLAQSGNYFHTAILQSAYSQKKQR